MKHNGIIIVAACVVIWTGGALFGLSFRAPVEHPECPTVTDASLLHPGPAGNADRVWTAEEWLTIHPQAAQHRRWHEGRK